MKKKLRVGVIFGGRSGEHEVSLMSAESVISAMNPEKFDVVPIGISKEGRWLVGPDALPKLKQSAIEGRPPGLIPSAFIADPATPGLIALEKESAPVPDGHLQQESFDVIFPVLHGPYGEDGTVQGLFELGDVPYVGCGVAASAVGMDKALMKLVFQAAGLPVLDWIQVNRGWVDTRYEEIAEEVARRLGYPCFVKPANLGSSVGVSRVDDPGSLRPALLEAAKYDRKILVEKAAVGCREVECAVLGNDDPQVSVPGEIVSSGAFYDYRAKYIDGKSELVIPARISEAAAAKVREMSRRAFLAIDGAGLARVDFFVHAETEEIWVNEINTMPGFTRFSMYPKLWEATGIPYPELIERLIELALERHAEKRRSRVTYEG